MKAPEIKDKEQCGEPDVLLDITGSGRAIVELFKREEIRPDLVRIVGVGRQEERGSDGDWRVPKVELVGALRVLYEAERLKMAKELDLVAELEEELRNFKMKPPRIDPNDPESWREGQNDDLIFAVALAAWRASRRVPHPRRDEPEFKHRWSGRGSGHWMGM